ncbi:MAG: hypothetical protein ILP13_01890 [Lachnospiraceae bacterium]|nr:hypothetical protein [Lachnospiraceae bacterium]
MSSASFIETLGVIVQTAVLLVFTVASATLIKRGRNILLTIFFTFALVSWMLSDLYWITYDLLRPGTRMPLAANEFGECALFLLLAAGLTPYIKKEMPYPKFGILYAILFNAANAALWIVWSGEWLQDIVCGIAMSVFSCTLVILLVQTDAVPRIARIVTVILSVFVVVFQAVSTYVKNTFTLVLEYSSYVMMYGVLIYLFIRAINMYRAKVRTKPFLLGTAAMIWNSFTLYMSPGIIYTVSLTIFTLTIPLMYIMLRREVLADDLC